jgi:hypothetical protein
MLLDNVFSSGLKKSHFLLLEHDLTRSTIPIIRDLIQKEIHSRSGEPKTRSIVMLVTFLHPSNVFVRDRDNTSGISILEKDYTSKREGSNPKLDMKFLRKDLMGTIEAGERCFFCIPCRKIEY